MNQHPVFVTNPDAGQGEPVAHEINIDQLLAIARRQWIIVAAAIVLALLIGISYLITAVPLYTASTSVLIDRGNSEVVQQLSTIGGVLDDEASVLSQVELLKSDTIGLATVDRLKLQNNPEFMASGGSFVATINSSIRSLLASIGLTSRATGELIDPEEALRRSALGRLKGGLAIQRVGRAYVLEIDFTSPSPGMAAAVANAVAESYISDKLDAKYQATRRAGEWLQDRIEELRQQSLASDLAVQKFRAANGLVTAGNGLVSDQQLTELNSALIVARADTARAQARYDRIQEILASGQTDAIVTDALDSSVINTLRQKFLNASKLESEISKRLGPDHVQAVRLRQEMSEYNRLMFDELKRIAESYQSELEVARSRERNITEGVRKATGVSVAASETQVQLRELERSAEAYKNLYQTFLQRYQEAVQQQSFPVTEARVISNAVGPSTPSSPRTSIVLAISVVVGLMSGCGIAAFREFRDRFFRTGDQIRDVLGVEYLGATPEIAKKTDNAVAAPGEKDIHFRSSVSNFSINFPLSSFSETLRSCKIAIDLNISKSSKVVGVVSTLPGEGKSTIALNLAQVLAKSGRTLLIDADLRNPGATRAIGQHAQAGLIQVLTEGVPYTSLLLHDAASGLDFLPVVVKRRITHSSELLASPQMHQLLTRVSAEYDYVVLDLPPLAPVVDARSIAGRVDGFIMVVEWGAVSRKVVKQTLVTEHQIAERTLGVVLNKVDVQKLKLYREYGSSDYYSSRYSSYYVDHET
ncbi:succinoglycan biosynthesis transport protein ExoP [Neorhizobium galegae]|uniref:polysaccharide biosynthesis tyrosine autokinase n=1 Tax=Neorhizobium galegae TaxID=399 RepID=UPI003D7C3133|nr:succinoglycan biosynthesis transport protein ExoP [Neorhizobium galegae]